MIQMRNYLIWKICSIEVVKMKIFNELSQIAFKSLLVLLIVFTNNLSLMAESISKNAPKKIFMVMLYPDETMVEKAFKEYFALKKRNVVFSGESVFNDKKNIP